MKNATNSLIEAEISQVESLISQQEALKEIKKNKVSMGFEDHRSPQRFCAEAIIYLAHQNET